jgi:glycosyl transferase family 2
LIATEDRGRVLFEPTSEGVEEALRRALSGTEALRPAQPAFEGVSSLRRWAEVIATRPPTPTRAEGRLGVDVVVVHRGSKRALVRCLELLTGQSYVNFRVIVAASLDTDGELDGLPPRSLVVRSDRGSVEALREAGLKAGDADWVVFLDEHDRPEPALLETLVRAQIASGADAVSCAVKVQADDGATFAHYFAGEPRGLGALANGYGAVALLRRSLLGEPTNARPAAGDADWPLLARLSVTGARIVSLPIPLLTRRGEPGTLEQPADALRVHSLIRSGHLAGWRQALRRIRTCRREPIPIVSSGVRGGGSGGPLSCDAAKVQRAHGLRARVKSTPYGT